MPDDRQPRLRQRFGARRAPTAGRTGFGHVDGTDASRHAGTRAAESHTMVALVGAAIAIVATLAMIAPRFAHTFPSMVDDWSAIENSVGQLPKALTGRNPEELRYRPAWIVWNALQWHTLGAPAHRWGPQVWGMLRLALLALGLSAIAATILRWPAGRNGRVTASALVAAVPLFVMTIPSFAVDIARWGPQEPLQVGSMSLGAALIVHSLRTARAGTGGPGPIVSLAVGVVFWWFGALQKETSLVVVVLAPFLWPYVRRDLPPWHRLTRERPRLVIAATAGVVAPLLLLAWHTVLLASADTRVYDTRISPGGVPGQVLDQLNDIDHTLGSPLAWLIIAFAFLTLLWAIERDIDLLALGLLTCGLAAAAWAGQTGVFVSRYYLPVAALVVLALVRSASAHPRRALVPAVVAVLLADRLNGGSEAPVDWLIRQTAHDAVTLGLIFAACVLALGIAFVAKVDRRALLAVAVSALMLAVVAKGTTAIVSDYYPLAALIALLGLSRRSPGRSRLVAPLVAALLVSVSLYNVATGRDSVEGWLDYERAQEALVRAVATREAGGCAVEAVGKEVELVQALPVLLRLVHEPASGCRNGERFVVVIDGELGSARTPPSNPALRACAPSDVVWRSTIARIVRCGVTA